MPSGAAGPKTALDNLDDPSYCHDSWFPQDNFTLKIIIINLKVIAVLDENSIKVTFL